jgi:enoyl-CoA hydratase/carnithine racemase
MSQDGAQRLPNNGVVLVDIADRVATVTLNRPDKLNAVSPAVFDGLYEAGERIAADDEVRAVLIRGEGRAFCSGLDLASLQAFGSEDAAGNGDNSGDRVPNRAQGGFSVWQRMSKPVVAAVQGYALGAGFQLALAADIRIAAEDAVMSVFEITYGLVPDLGGTQLLPRIVGPARAKELIWTAHRMSAEEALAWGIVNRVVPVARLEEEARTLVADLAARPPLPIRFTKELVEKAGKVPLEEGMRAEIEAQIRCITSNDMREAVAAAFEKRQGTYSGT